MAASDVSDSHPGVLFIQSHFLTYGKLNVFMVDIFISRLALAREGDYEMMPVCACVRACVRALVSHADSSKTTTATDFL